MDLARPLKIGEYIRPVRDLSQLTSAIISCFGVVAVLSGNLQLQGAPIIPGLHQKHPLNETQKGALLVEELRCASCHEGITSAAAAGPDLRDVGSRVKPDFLKKFILDPAAHDPGTAMPNVLGSLSAEGQEKTAASLSAYLLSLKSEPVKPLALPKDEAHEGQKLFHEAGCIACHSPRDGSDAAKSLVGMIGLNHVSSKYHPAGLSDFLHEPLKVRPDGRMPDMRLNRRESELLAAFLIGSEANEDNVETPSAQEIAAGKKAFTEMNCSACHNVDAASKAPLNSILGLPKPKLDLNAGCLSATPGKAPNYSLSDEQRSAIRSVLTEQPKPPTPAEAVNFRLTQLNCIACHQRDDYGGVKLELDGYFHSTEEALGNQARIPPELTLTGAKLQPEWLNKVLYEGETVRPYMTTRMPQFGNVALKGLDQLFGEADKLPPLEFKPLDKESTPEMKDGAHMLLGDQGLNCIACHNYNGKESPGMKGLDLMTSYQRLQPAWFDQFLRNPAKFRPGIIMPSYWPDGKALQTEILNGNAEDQIRALWFNFSLGRSARDPSGLRAENPELIVTDQTRTYRGRSDVAGYRGIAVGYPGGLNYAFNAQNGALSAIWPGKYVTVGWRAQGSGNFSPAAPVIQLAQDVAFLTDLPEAWPLRPIRTKENPVNPDPTYPSQYGYAFKGYSIGEKGVPTLRYLCGDVAIEDTSDLLTADEIPTLRRTFTFKTEKRQVIHFRALTGDVTISPTGSFTTSKLELTPAPTESFLFATSDLKSVDETNKELIITLNLPAGISTYSLVYALRP
jgi:mono/diheme cytochrome c family protein